MAAGKASAGALVSRPGRRCAAPGRLLGGAMLSPKATVRRLLERAGYWSAHRSVLPLGVDPIWDMQRLAARHGFTVRRVFDIGAHVGVMSQAFLDGFPEARVDAFEPHPNSFACLEQLTSDRLAPHKLAMSDAPGEGRFFVYADVEDPTEAKPASMNNSLVETRQFGLIAGQYSRSIAVEKSTVDLVCQQQGVDALELIKIDTEDHEREVLVGAAETLAGRGVRFVFLEFETVLPIAEATGGALAPCAALLEPLGFHMVAIYQNTMVDQPLYVSLNALFLRA
jgi:FkbM family methyltransferase